MKNIFISTVALFLLAASAPTEGFSQRNSASGSYLDLISRYEKGDRAKAFNIGSAFYNGTEGAPRDHRKAAEWLGKAASAGSREAMELLGDMSYDAAKPDKAAAYAWYRKAAAAGSPRCSYMAGRLLMFGEGVRENRPEALKLFAAAYERGYVTAAANAADIYASGRGLKRDASKSLEWLVRGALGGDTVCMRKLGEAYYAGDGTPRNLPEAYRWLWVAAAKENNPAVEKMLAGISKRMSAAELAQGKKLAAESAASLVTKEDREFKTYEKTLKGG